jgi:CsoR family transcriptional regulator, copper-sensing transcriptional repressor
MKKDIKKKAIRRLRIIGGQIKGLERMVQGDKYCVDIITQSLAAKEALSGVENLILENHLETHVVEQIKSGRKLKAVNEVMKIHKLSKTK